jgi:hypothetical protein
MELEQNKIDLQIPLIHNAPGMAFHLMIGHHVRASPQCLGDGGF